MPRYTTLQEEFAGLDDRQAKFVLEYAAHCHVTRAALNAGYAKRSAASQGSDLLRSPKIQDAIRAVQRERASRLGLDGDWLVLQLFGTYQDSRAAGQYSAAVKALENIGKLLGAYAEHNRQRASAEESKSRLRSWGIDPDALFAGRNGSN